MASDHLIYCHTNLINGYKYIGQAHGDPTERWGKDGKGYLKSKKLNKRSLGQAILDYGWDNFSHEILESNLTQEEANAREQYWIDYYNTWIGGSDSAKGYNLSKGGGHRECCGHVENPISIGITISSEDYELLKKIALEEKRSISWVTREILHNYFQNK